MNSSFWGGWVFVSDHKTDATEDAGTPEDATEGAGECRAPPLALGPFLQGKYRGLGEAMASQHEQTIKRL